MISFKEYVRDYKAEYKKFQSSPERIKYRAELVKYNREKGTYGNGDGKDASHKNGKIVGFEKESKNRGRKEKSRLKGSIREDVSKNDLDQVEKYADKVFAAVGIDVEFTRHFLDRVNDERNKKPINTAELIRLFRLTYKKHGKKIPKMGPRPDHINDPAYDRASVDLPELKLLGDRQLQFLDQWTDEWSGATMKAVLSQTAF